MGTIAEKLQNILAAKADIGVAIAEKGGTVPQRFSEYGNAIRALPGDGGVVPFSPLDAKKLYAARRDPLWPPMPEDVPEHTIVFLYTGAGEVDFTVTCETQYTVETKLCTCSDGVWSYDVESIETFDSKANCLFLVNPNPENKPVYRLVTVSASSITAFAFTDIAEKIMPGCIEVLYRLPNARMKFENMKDVMYITGLGKAGGTASTNLCRNCSSLVCFIGPDLQLMGSHIYCFTGCKNLMAVDTSFGKDGIMRYAFQGCEKLTAVPATFFGHSVACDKMFEECHSLREAHIENLVERDVSCLSLFSGCFSLEKVSISGAVNLTRMQDAFLDCISLKQLVFDLPNWSGVDFSIENCAFDRKGLVKLFESLPAITVPHTIILTGNPGVAGLTEGDKTIATGKGWSLSL